MVKNYMLDTNILLQNPNAIFDFQDNNIWICGTTLQELDEKKDDSTEIGYHARESARIIDEYRKKGKLTEGVPLPNNGKLFVEPDGVKKELLPEGYSLAKADNRIISSCLYLNKTKCKNSPIILLSNDHLMRVNASVCGVNVQEVINDHVEETSYTGHVELQTTQKRIDRLYKEKYLDATKEEIETLYQNEFITFKYGKQSALAIYREGQFKLIPRYTLFGGVKPLNRMQTFAIYALMAPVEEIPLVILQGTAGTAKTFLSLAAGLTQTKLSQSDGTERFKKMLISRPNAGNADPGFGYLPGDLDEKMAPLLASYYDNLETLLEGNSEGKYEDPALIRDQIDEFFETGSIEVCPLNFIRGRSITNSYLICDEAQNATKSLIRDVVSRAGTGTKIIITGDDKQTDAPTLDAHNNGLVHVAKRMRNQAVAAYLKFGTPECVRSTLAEVATELL